METKEHTKFVDSIVAALRKAAIELEEFQVQVALGKAEASDTYEQIKKNLHLLLHEGKYNFKKGKDKIEDLKEQLDTLRVQLELGKAETIEEFKAQKKKLLLAFHDIEVKIKTNEKLNRFYANLLVKIELFKVQLEILEEKFEGKKEKAKVTFQKGKKEFNEFVERLTNKYGKKEVSKWEHFQGEISEAFSHFKKAFVTS